MLGGRSLQALVEQAEAGYARLSEALPPGAPDDWRLVCSRPPLGEYERKLRGNLETRVISLIEERTSSLRGRPERPDNSPRLVRTCVRVMTVQSTTVDSHLPRSGLAYAALAYEGVADGHL